tara:strand:- start:386 stop:610 length:225 start_codon:yes stop_codon:yes gene_type:complete
MYIVKVRTNKTKHVKNANNKVIRTRQLKQKHFKEFKTLQEVENYITELNIGVLETNEYGNTTEVIGTTILKEIN